MIASVQHKKRTSGKTYLYIVLSYKDLKTCKSKVKWISTGLEEKGNIRKAEKMIPDIIEKYKYLEEDRGLKNAELQEIMLHDYIKLWLERKRGEVELSTYEGYKMRATHIIDYFEKRKTKVVLLTAGEIDEFLRYLCLYGKTNKKTKELEPLSVRSVRSVKSILLAAMNQAIIDGIIKENPVLPVKVRGKKNTDYRKEECFMNAEEATDLLVFIYEKYPRIFLIAFMCLQYGLRRSEILGLKWSAIDFDKKIFTIKHTVVRVTTVEEKDSTKTRSSLRTLQLFDSTKEYLLKAKKEQEEYEKFYGNTYTDNEGYIFTWENGKKYDPDYISKLFKKATKEYGRPEITLHKLRHSCASISFDLGWNPKRVQSWLGHSDYQTTMNIYTHYEKEKLTRNNTDLEHALDIGDKLNARNL